MSRQHGTWDSLLILLVGPRKSVCLAFGHLLLLTDGALADVSARRFFAEADYGTWGCTLAVAAEKRETPTTTAAVSLSESTVRP